MLQAALGKPRDHFGGSDLDIYCTMSAAPYVRGWLVGSDVLQVCGGYSELYRYGAGSMFPETSRYGPISHVEYYINEESIEGRDCRCVTYNQRSSQLKLKNGRSFRLATNDGDRSVRCVNYTEVSSKKKMAVNIDLIVLMVRTRCLPCLFPVSKFWSLRQLVTSCISFTNSLVIPPRTRYPSLIWFVVAARLMVRFFGSPIPIWPSRVGLTSVCQGILRSPRHTSPTWQRRQGGTYSKWHLTWDFRGNSPLTSGPKVWIEIRLTPNTANSLIVSGVYSLTRTSTQKSFKNEYPGFLRRMSHFWS